MLQNGLSSVRKKTAQTLWQFAEVHELKQKDPIKISVNDLAQIFVAGYCPRKAKPYYELKPSPCLPFKKEPFFVS